MLLLDHTETRILRAFPLPGLPPHVLLAGDDRIVCARHGDGDLPDSMLCSIDRTTFDWHVRVVPLAVEASMFLPVPDDHWVPDHWVIGDPEAEAVGDPFMLALSDGLLVTASSDGLWWTWDPVTLELLPEGDPRLLGQPNPVSGRPLTPLEWHVIDTLDAIGLAAQRAEHSGPWSASIWVPLPDDGALTVFAHTGPWDVPHVDSQRTTAGVTVGTTTYGAAQFVCGETTYQLANDVPDGFADVDELLGAFIVALACLGGLDAQEACPFVAPAQLLSGATPGPMRVVPAGGADAEYAEWGEGTDRLMQHAGLAALQATGGHEGFDPMLWQDPDLVVPTPDGPRYVILVGDEGVGQVQVRFVHDGCAYVSFLPEGTTVQQALDFAARMTSS